MTFPMHFGAHLFVSPESIAPIQQPSFNVIYYSVCVEFGECYSFQLLVKLPFMRFQPLVSLRATAQVHRICFTLPYPLVLAPRIEVQCYCFLEEICMESSNQQFRQGIVILANWYVSKKEPCEGVLGHFTINVKGAILCDLLR